MREGIPLREKAVRMSFREGEGGDWRKGLSSWDSLQGKGLSLGNGIDGIPEGGHVPLDRVW